jgi:hypothetical protein
VEDFQAALRQQRAVPMLQCATGLAEAGGTD